ncbi:MAG: hypothetical protein OEL20_05225 [Sulfuritalea sp.]|nr:hypothetical protein [Sulfuritalea sp.]
MKTIKRFTERGFGWMSDARNADKVVTWGVVAAAAISLTTGA